MRLHNVPWLLGNVASWDGYHLRLHIKSSDTEAYRPDDSLFQVCLRDVEKLVMALRGFNYISRLDFELNFTLGTLHNQASSSAVQTALLEPFFALTGSNQTCTISGHVDRVLIETAQARMSPTIHWQRTYDLGLLDLLEHKKQLAYQRYNASNYIDAIGMFNDMQILLESETAKYIMISDQAIFTVPLLELANEIMVGRCLSVLRVGIDLFDRGHAGAANYFEPVQNARLVGPSLDNPMTTPALHGLFFSTVAIAFLATPDDPFPREGVIQSRNLLALSSITAVAHHQLVAVTTTLADFVPKTLDQEQIEKKPYVLPSLDEELYLLSKLGYKGDLLQGRIVQSLAPSTTDNAQEEPTFDVEHADSLLAPIQVSFEKYDRLGKRFDWIGGRPHVTIPLVPARSYSEAE